MFGYPGLISINFEDFISSFSLLCLDKLCGYRDVFNQQVQYSSDCNG